MVPRPQYVKSTLGDIVPSQKINHDSEEKEVKRHPEFTYWDYPFGMEQKYFNWIWISTAHVFGIWYFYLMWGGYIESNTIIFELFYVYFGGLGTTVGCHRYWTHKTFKAKLPLQILLMIMQTVNLQYPIYKWCLDHRIHHKYTDTDADPHNSKRGLLFSHIGWLYLPKHPELKKRLKTFDMPDLENDPVVRFQSRHYVALAIFFHTVLPVFIFHYFFGLPVLYAVAANYRRYLMSLHFTFMVNSFAHKWGDKPYDKNITSVENAFVSLFAVGEGWHNYHHTFPWDYKTSEFGWKINASTIFIDFCAMIGWASEMKTVSQKMLKERLRRTGDGSHASAYTHDSNDNEFDFTTSADVSEMMKNMDHPLWGWDDEKMTEDLRSVTEILKPGNCQDD